MSLVDRFIDWAVNRAEYAQPVGAPHALFDRYEFLWPDEYGGENRPPWWRPFNVLLHHWKRSEGGRFHDHPRWSITICLKGRILEQSPWATRVLTPGAVVFRSRKAIHRFDLLPGDEGNTWTLFIVGRRNHRQNWFNVTPFGSAA